MVPCTLSTAPCTPFLTALEKMLRYPTWIGFIHCRIHSLIHSIPQKGSPRSCLSSLGMICQISKMISIIRVSRLFTLFQPCPIKKRLSFAEEITMDHFCVQWTIQTLKPQPQPQYQYPDQHLKHQGGYTRSLTREFDMIYRNKCYYDARFCFSLTTPTFSPRFYSIIRHRSRLP